jgi:murein L,D-transpeptidase YcbB/YkuD
MPRMLPVIIALCPLAGCVSMNAHQTDVAKHLRDRLAARAAIHGERLIKATAVRRFYERRGHRPAWSDADADQVAQAIRDIERDGLTPATYHLATIDALLTRRAGGSSAQDDADRDLLLTDAVAAIIDDVRFGRVRPVDLDPRWNVDPRAGAPPLEVRLAKVVSAGSVRRAIEQERPNHFIYRGLLDALARLCVISARGGWRTVPPGRTLRPGAVDRRIPAIRSRLLVSGDLPAGSDDGSTRYDPELRRAVERFQDLHRLEPDGLIDTQVIGAMNVSVDDRIDQVRVNLERARWVLGGLRDPFLLVNLPAFKAYLIREGRVAWESRTQVGDEGTQTPSFRADMRTIVFNPDWTVPPVMLANEVIDSMRANPAYLAARNLGVFDGHGRDVDPHSIDWGHVDPDHFPYVIRQPPGADNALGQVKFLFPNPWSIYLHDTPSRTLFDAEDRTFSHGCIRIEHPLELARLLLEGQDGWDQGRIDQAVESGQTQEVALDRRITVLIVYWTVSVGASGEIRYTRDVYDLDPGVLAALGGHTTSRREPTAGIVPPRAAAPAAPRARSRASVS